MILTIRGVYLDGSTWGAGVDQNMAQPLNLWARNDVTVRLRVINPQGVPVAVNKWSAVVLTVRPPTAGAAATLTLAGAADPQNGGWAFTIADTQTPDTRVAPGLYVYDVYAVATDGGARDTLVPLSAFRLQASVGGA